MDTTRRSFLRGVLSLAVVAAVGTPSAAVAGIPRIVGDGAHDDTDGLQAMFDGEPFSIEGEGFVASSGTLDGGVFRTTKTLALRGVNDWRLKNFKLLFDPGDETQSYAFYVADCSNISFAGISVVGANVGSAAHSARVRFLDYAG